ncbi:SxtJ family membrane protein [Isosphaeraceae bacterium EP7]
MIFPEVSRNPPTRQLRQFSVMLTGLILILGMARNWPLGWIGAGVALGLTGLALPSIARPIFVGWMIAVSPIRWMVSKVLLGLVFYGLVTPIGLMLRLMGHDPLRLGPDPSATSYWEPKPIPGDVSSYFRQY